MVVPTFESHIFWTELQQELQNMTLTSQLLLFSYALYTYVFEIVTLYNNLFKSHIQYSAVYYGYRIIHIFSSRSPATVWMLATQTRRADGIN
jgi:hypothetical protein